MTQLRTTKHALRAPGSVRRAFGGTRAHVRRRRCACPALRGLLGRSRNGVSPDDTNRYVLTRLGAIGRPHQREWDALWGDTGALLGVAACSWGLLYMSLVAALRAAGRGSRAPAIASYLVSTVHAALAVGGFAHVCVADAGVRGAVLSLDHQAAVFGSHPLRDAYLLVTAGYMLYDAATCAAYVRELGDRLTYAHHAVVAGAIVVGVLMQCCTAYMAVLLVQEVSTPFVNARKLGRMGFCCVGRRREAELAACIGVTFFVSRVVAAFAVLWHILRSYRVLLSAGLLSAEHWPAPVFARVLAWFAPFPALTALAFAHAALNLVWFVGIALRLRAALAVARDKRR